MKWSPKKKRKALLVAVWLAAITVILTGCTWSKPGGTAEAFENDMYQCQVQAAPAQDPILHGMIRDRCMRVKGWRQ